MFGVWDPEEAVKYSQIGVNYNILSLIKREFHIIPEVSISRTEVSFTKTFWEKLQKYPEVFDQFYVDADGYFQYHIMNVVNTFIAAVQEYTGVKDCLQDAPELYQTLARIIIPLFSMVIYEWIKGALDDPVHRTNLPRYLRRAVHKDLSTISITISSSISTLAPPDN